MNRHYFTAAVVTAALLAIPSLADNVTPPLPGYTINIPNTNTDLKIYGSVKFNLTHNFNADHYFKDPLLESRESGPTNTNRINIEKSYFGFSTITPSTKLGHITTNLDIEANGSYENKDVTLKLRNATISFGNWTIGRAESTFVDTDASPEALSPAAPIGQPNFDVSKFNLVRYAASIGKYSSFAVSFEDGISKPDKIVDLQEESKHYTHSSKCPTMVGALTYSNSWGHAGIRVLEQNWSTYHDGYLSPTQCRWALATQLSGAVNIGKDKLVGTIYTGKGLGVYGSGSASESRIVIDQGAKTPYKIMLNNQVGWQLGYTHNWNNKVRSNVASSHVNIIERDFEPCLKNAQDYIINTMFNITNDVEVGVEYLLQRRKNNRDFTSNSTNNEKRRLDSNQISAMLTAKF